MLLDFFQKIAVSKGRAFGRSPHCEPSEAFRRTTAECGSWRGGRAVCVILKNHVPYKKPPSQDTADAVYRDEEFPRGATLVWPYRSGTALSDPLTQGYAPFCGGLDGCPSPGISGVCASQPCAHSLSAPPRVLFLFERLFLSGIFAGRALLADSPNTACWD